MAAAPVERVGDSGATAARLTPFSADHADRVASWVRSPLEARWLAPRTPPPITAARVLAWHGPDRDPCLLFAGDEPVAYGEVNILDVRRREYWLGHLLVDPSERGRGFGKRLTYLLMQRAFQVHQATDVSLVVFPENRVAIQCYRSLGLRETGYEVHRFAGGSSQRMTRMTIGAARFDAIGSA